jgi:hypothetical protein
MYKKGRNYPAFSYYDFIMNFIVLIAVLALGKAD